MKQQFFENSVFYIVNRYLAELVQQDNSLIVFLYIIAVA